jgi:hypothetical protein
MRRTAPRQATSDRRYGTRFTNNTKPTRPTAPYIDKNLLLTFPANSHIIHHNNQKQQTFEQEEYKRSGVSREPLHGGNAAAQIFSNGLARAARNHCFLRVDADGNPVRYQWGAYDGTRMSG